MKEIKAYIRRGKAEEVIHALEEAGVSGITIIEVKSIGGAPESERGKYSIEYAEQWSPTVKLEAVCRDEDSQRLVNIIKEKAYSGHRGDGFIFVSEVSYAVKIRTGETGEAALRPENR